MDEQKQSATEDFAIAIGAGMSLAGQVFMWMLAIPWFLIGAAVILNRSGHIKAALCVSGCRIRGVSRPTNRSAPAQ